MLSLNKKERIILFLGDIVSFYISLFLMLFVRYFHVPSGDLVQRHLAPFTIIFAVWVAVYFIAGLYEKHTRLLRSKISSALINAQIANSILAVLFFYFIPYFGITPKTNLFIALALSFGAVLVWRLSLFPLLQIRKRQNAVLIGTGLEMKELEEEVNGNARYDIKFTSVVDLASQEHVDLEQEVAQTISNGDGGVVVADFTNAHAAAMLPKLYRLLFSNVRVFDMHQLYEDIFDRIPLSLVKYSWFLEYIAGATEKSYDILKRGMDIVLASIIGVISLIFYPFVCIAILIEDAGPLFFHQKRIGKNGKVITVVKFRSYSVHKNTHGLAEESAKPTVVGTFLRRTRIDELPQVWNVLKGDLSLIGPRPEVPALVEHYEKEIPYYNVRHLIKPGLAGWAQLYQADPPKFAVSVDQTKIKLSYDLYYIKNRSLLLDLKIALRTIKTLLSREGV